MITFRLRRGELDESRPITLAQLDAARGNGPAGEQVDGEEGNALVQEVRRFAQAGAKQCDFELRGTPNRVIAAAPERFRAANRRLGFFVNKAACGPHKALVTGGTLTVSRLPDTKRVVGPKQLSYVAGQNPLEYVGFACGPDTDGRRRYQVGLIADRGGAVQSPFDGQQPSISLGVSRRTATLACPSRTERQANEFNAWLRRGGWSTRTSRYATSSASELLRFAMAARGALPPTSGRLTWDAHHIIPAREPSPTVRDIACVGRALIRGDYMPANLEGGS